VAWSDAELVRKTLAGDREAFGKLVERHRRTVFALSVQRGFQQSEADDLAQETFVRAFKSLAYLQDPEQFARWLYGIAGHVAADAARARKRRREGGNVEDAPDLAALEDRHEHGDADQETERVFRAMAELPEEQRLVLTLRYLEGLSPKEIAERLGQPRGTVRSRLHHALAFLQQAFGLKVRAGS
jgi:RNA polymerase sigma-70 factor (ECF subfamily)